MNKILLTWSVCFLSVWAVAQSQFRQTVSGLEFNIVEKHEGKTARIGDLVTLHLLLVADNGYEVKNSYKEGKPTLFPIKYQHHDADIYEAISLMAEGDSAIFKLNADSTYQKVFKKEMPKQVAKGSMLTLYAKVYKIRSQREYKTEQQEKFEATYNTKWKEAKAPVDKQIEAYLKKDESAAMFQKSEDLYIKLIEEGQGKAPVKGQAVMFHFTTYLLDGTKVESSHDMGYPVSFTIGEYNVIEGWELAFPQVKEGSEFELLVPSYLAYGPLAKGKIPANACLRFEIKLIKVQ